MSINGRLPVLNKRDILEALQHGCTLDYFTIEGKVYIRFDMEKIGAVRFDTFLKIRKEWNLVENGKWNYLYESYMLLEY